MSFNLVENFYIGLVRVIHERQPTPLAAAACSAAWPCTGTTAACEPRSLHSFRPSVCVSVATLALVEPRDAALQDYFFYRQTCLSVASLRRSKESRVTLSESPIE